MFARILIILLMFLSFYFISFIFVPSNWHAELPKPDAWGGGKVVTNVWLLPFMGGILFLGLSIWLLVDNIKYHG